MFHSSVKRAPSRLSWHQLTKPVKRRRKTKKANFVLGSGGHSIPSLLVLGVSLQHGKENPSWLFSLTYFPSLKLTNFNKNSEAQNKWKYRPFHLCMCALVRSTNTYYLPRHARSCGILWDREPGRCIRCCNS